MRRYADARSACEAVYGRPLRDATWNLALAELGRAAIRDGRVGAEEARAVGERLGRMLGRKRGEGG